MTIQDKEHFLLNEYTGKLSSLPADAPRKWGKMNVQQMIEHMADYVRIANGRTPMHIVTTEEQLPGLQKFLMSEKPFPENTPNALMPETPPAVRHATTDAAIAELQDELTHFAQVYAADSGKKLANPFFGVLDHQMQIQLLHKHATHHLLQFGAE